MPEDRIVVDPYSLNIETILRGIYNLIFGSGRDFDSFLGTLSGIWQTYSIFSFIISALLLFGTLYAMFRFNQIIGEEKEQLRAAEHAYRHAHGEIEENARWKQVLDHVASENPNEWRLAIIEADIMLGELLEEKGYVGTSIGEQLKTARPEVFRTLEDAWAAHKLRNQIAHRGSDFVLTKRVAQDAITQYRHVFDEFNFI